MPRNNLVGQRFGHLVVLESAGNTAKKPHRSLWRCQCDCGAERIATADAMRHSGTRTCDNHPPTIRAAAPRTDVELAWAAGLFEGEGTVRINKPTKRNIGALIASVVNTDIQVIEYFAERWPGRIRPQSGLDPLRQRPAWVWQVAAHPAASFLTQIQPFIVRDRVKERIAHGLAFQAGKRSSRVNRTQAYAEEQWNAYWWMCELNKRGVEQVIES